MLAKVSVFLNQLIAEIHRRKVLRVVAIYTIIAWLALQVAEVTFEPLGIPVWVMRLLIFSAIAGLPISLFLAWVIDIRPEGMIFDLPLWVSAAEQPRPRKNSDFVYLTILAVSLIGGTAMVLSLLIEDPGLINPTNPAMSSTDEHLTSSGTLNEKLKSGAASSVNDGARINTPPTSNSIAVLKFANLDGQDETGYFGAGLAEEILYLLAGIRELAVVARTSSFSFENATALAPEIASLLGVTHILEGSARHENNVIRAQVFLIEGIKGDYVWKGKYDRPADDIFQIQEEIASAVVKQLKIVLSLESTKLLRDQPTQDAEAYVLYLEGLGRLRRSMDADVMRSAGKLFERTLESDPDFSRAHAGLCEVYLRLYKIGNSPQDFERAESACNRANELDPGNNSEISLAKGMLYRYQGDLVTAEKEIQSSLALDPGAVDSLIEMGEILSLQSQRTAEAETALKQAIEFEPYYWKAHEALGNFYYEKQRYKEAATAYERAAELAPDVASLFGALGVIYWLLDDHSNAVKNYNNSLRLKPSRQGYTNLGLRYYYAGQYSDAAAMQLKAIELSPNDHKVWGRLAESYRFIPGANEKALRAYETAAVHAEETLAINGNDSETKGLLALYYAHLGQREAALELVAQAVEMSGNNAELLYFQALVHLEFEDHHSALDALEAAVRNNASYDQFIRSDPDLRVLKDETRFQALIRQRN